VLVWAVVCLMIHRAFRDVAWLAGPTVASALFLVGVTVAASFLVAGALPLAPVWFGVVGFLLVHLRAASRAGRSAAGGRRGAVRVRATGAITPSPARGGSSLI
jgi:hypothetical protein